MDRLQDDLPEEAAQQQRGRLRALLQDLAERRNALLDPRERRNAENRLPRVLERLHLDGELVHQSFGLDKSLGQGRAGLGLAARDEVDDPGDTAPSVIELRHLAGEHVGNIREEALDLHADTLEDMPESLRAKEPLPDGTEDDVLDPPPGNPDAVVAGSPSGGQAAVIPVALAAHEANVGTAAAADHRAAEQMRRKHGHTRRPGRLVAALGAAGPDLPGFLPALHNQVPEFLRNDAQVLELADIPLLLGLLVGLPATRKDGPGGCRSCSRPSGRCTWCW